MLQTRTALPVHITSISRTSIPNDNNGIWFLASYKYSAKYLEDRFQSRMQGIGSILYNRVGGIVQGPRKSIYIQIQLVMDAIVGVDLLSKEPVWKTIPSYNRDEKPWPEWGVEVCLQEIGVELQHTVPLETVLTAFHMRGRA